MSDPWDINAYRFEPYTGRGKYSTLVVRVGGRLVEITVSPTGKSVQIHVDGEKVEP